VDVLWTLIAENQKKFGAPHRNFLRLDITRDALPKADLILCRDCLVHFSFQDIFRALPKFQEQQRQISVDHNVHRPTAQYRHHNRRLAAVEPAPPPFNFPAPLKVIDEKCTENRGQYRDKNLA